MRHFGRVPYLQYPGSMKALSNNIFISIILFTLPITTSSQAPVDLYDSNNPLSYPKTYLHTDREVYFIGDSIWFKAYYLDGLTQKFFPGDFSLYTELFDDRGRTVDSQVLILEKGQSTGKIEIPDSIHPGNYLLRAFTDYQRSIGEEVFFHKKLKITSVENRMDEALSESEEPPADIDVAFLPEGGILLPGQKNCVGIKAVDNRGVGISIKGEIVDGNGEIVSFFSTEYKGMGVVQFHPEHGKRYYARIQGFPEFDYTFDDLAKEGIKIEYSDESNDNLTFKITTNSEIFLGKTYYFAILHRGRVLFNQKFVQKAWDLPLRIQKAALSGGINRFVLMDEQFKPISERLYFSDNFQLNEIQIISDQDAYQQRSKVQLELLDDDEYWEAGSSNLSVAVIDAHALTVNGPKHNIQSWLLFDSELKGSIESPAHFFVNDDYFSSREKLNLLMLTHGWSTYIWTTLAENPPVPVSSLSEGMTLKGTVKHAFTKKPIPKGDVELNIYSEGGFVNAVNKTDRGGKFVFDNIVFSDTASVFIQGRNKKGKLYTELEIEPFFSPNPKLQKQYFPKNDSKRSYSSGLYEQQYYSDLDLKNFVLENGSILLEEVSITKKKDTGDGHFRMYAKPYNSLKITERDYGYRNVGDYLQGRVSGVMVVGNQILIRGIGSFSYSPPLFLLDGTPHEDQDVVMNIPMADIDIIEVLKNPHELGVFGTRAGSGVISVFTKRGGGNNWRAKYVQGTISTSLMGYSSYKEFYSPKYTPVNKSSARPDHRLTLHWEPVIFTKDGKATITFFTSDDAAKYKVIVEGITAEGRICFGIGDLIVEQVEKLGHE